MAEDHPHIHGEYEYVAGGYSYIQGSPPHTWGILEITAPFISTIRITPTYMGNTIDTNQTKGDDRDHPHIHGEYTKKSLIGRGFYIRNP